jgi:transcriptional regulator with XRE-family HTH domain
MFKEKLKELREKEGISQYELANKIFVSRSAVAKWENGLGMPNEESIELLSQFFAVSKDELLNSNDPVKIIDNVERKSKRIVIILASILCLFVVSFTSIFIKVMVDKHYEDSMNPQHGKFYSQEYLSKFKLEGLEMIDGVDYLLMGKDGKSFYSYIESYEVFNDYAKYIYDKLNYSISISYLSFEKEIYEHSDPISKNTDYYLFPSNSLENHIDKTFDNGLVHIYSFYYITNLDNNRNNKDSINVNHIELQFLFSNNHKITDKNWFKMTILNDDNNEIAPNMYLSNEFFDIKEISINNDNINEYIVPYVYEDKTAIRFYARGSYNHSPINPDPISPFQLFVKVTFKLTNKDNGEYFTVYKNL